MEENRFGLRLIKGGLRREIAFGSLRIIASPKRFKPFEIDAIALEEDTWLTISADAEECNVEWHPIRIMTALIEARPAPIGRVFVRGKKPLRFLTVIYDVDEDPIWKEEWVEAGLGGIFRKAEVLKISSLGLPLLGTIHGHLEKERFAFLLSKTLIQTTLSSLRHLWLIASLETSEKITQILQSGLDPIR